MSHAINLNGLDFDNLEPIAVSMLYPGYATGQKDYKAPGDTLENGSALCVSKGDSSVAPVIVLGGNAMSGQESIVWFKRVFEPLFPKMPSVYSMDYAGTGPVNEESLIKNASLVMKHVLANHNLKPHGFGVSLGCAVILGLADRAGPKCFQSFTLMDPFTTFGDMANSFLKKKVGGFASMLPINPKKQILRNKTNTWLSDKRIADPDFREIPLCILSGTNDTVIPPIMHNRLYAASFGKGTAVPPVSRSKTKVTKGKTKAGGPRMLVEIKGPHISAPWEKLFESNSELQDFYSTHVTGTPVPKLEAYRTDLSSNGWTKWILPISLVVIAVSVVVILVYCLSCRAEKAPRRPRN